MDLNFNGRVNGFYNGMKMDKLMGNIMRNEFGKRFDYNEKRV